MRDALSRFRLDPVDAAEAGLGMGDPQLVEARSQVGEGAAAEVDGGLEVRDLSRRRIEARHAAQVVLQSPHLVAENGDPVGALRELDRRPDREAALARRSASAAGRQDADGERRSHGEARDDNAEAEAQEYVPRRDRRRFRRPASTGAAAPVATLRSESRPRSPGGGEGGPAEIARRAEPPAGSLPSPAR